MNFSSEDRNFIIISGLILMLVLGASLGLAWYRAGVQRAVWKREGIHLTQFEIFTGAKPATRVISEVIP